MGLLINSNNDIDELVRQKFGERGYLVAFKHDTIDRNFLKLLISSFVYVMDNSRSYILVFDKDGIYEKEISNKLKRNFVLMPWHEINEFDVNVKNRKAIISFFHVGKRVGYEVPLKGTIYKNNPNHLKKLLDKSWNQV